MFLSDLLSSRRFPRAPSRNALRDVIRFVGSVDSCMEALRWDKVAFASNCAAAAKSSGFEQPGTFMHLQRKLGINIFAQVAPWMFRIAVPVVIRCHS
jgi:hypothetical protein